ncbi:Down syndrome cell adhesion molecule-like isoform X2 [Gouania willdenowi]|uniref:Down syndrome cell adhesion molecule-like isoform X2 n=1 Tax=Gouania willdenowi TaxID=441366 RepID=UPI001054C933|nr:Down syndrome cell adhesion molecule-like isoform X2 [Gouania willdenowi]
MKVWDRKLLTVSCSFVIFALHVTVSTGTIIATVGTDVTLTCNYDAKYHGKLSVCWGRGDIPNRGCASEVIRSDGTSVISRLSERYLLLGDIDAGDVSLTIRQLQESDSGTYGCRVDIPGWFNDLKYQIILSVNPVRPNPLRIETKEVKERTVTVGWNPVFNGGRPITMYRIDLKNKQASWDTAVRTEMSNPDLTQVTLVDLRPAKTYSLRMFAMNSMGISESSNVLTVTTKEAAPEGPPLDMKLEAINSHRIKVTWKPPRPDLRNGILRSYSISYREFDPAGRHFGQWHHISVKAMQEIESLLLDKLKPSTMYGVLVQAKTHAGIGPASTAPLCSTLDNAHESTTASSASYPPAATVWIEDQSPETATATVWEQSTASNTSVAPDPPLFKLKEVKDNTVSLSWIPGYDGDSPITGYYLEYKAVNATWDYTKTVVDFGPNQTEATIIEINPSTYNIRMFAKNNRATSKPSNVLTITTGEPGHQWDISTAATDTQAVSAEEGHGGHLAAILVPVLLVMVIVAIATVWQIKRIKQSKGTLSMWLTSGAIRYRGAESLQEL